MRGAYTVKKNDSTGKKKKEKGNIKSIKLTRIDNNSDEDKKQNRLNSSKNNIKGVKNDENINMLPKKTSKQEEKKEVNNSTYTTDEINESNLSVKNPEEDRNIPQEQDRPNSFRNREESSKNEVEKTLKQEAYEETKHSGKHETDVDKYPERKKEKNKSKKKDNETKKPMQILNLNSQLINIDADGTKKESIQFIELIKNKAREFEKQIESYSGTNYSVKYFVIDENLMLLLEELDKVKFRENKELLQEKINTINYIKQLHKQLDQNVTEN